MLSYVIVLIYLTECFRNTEQIIGVSKFELLTPSLYVKIGNRTSSAKSGTTLFFLLSLISIQLTIFDTKKLMSLVKIFKLRKMGVFPHYLIFIHLTALFQSIN